MVGLTGAFGNGIYESIKDQIIEITGGIGAPELEAEELELEGEEELPELCELEEELEDPLPWDAEEWLPESSEDVATDTFLEWFVSEWLFASLGVRERFPKLIMI